MLSAPLLSSDGVVTLVVNVGLLVMDTTPVGEFSRLPDAATTTVPLLFGTVMVRLAVSVAGEKAALKPSAVPSLNTNWPRLLALPRLRPVVPCRLKLAKVGLAVLLIS